MNCLSPGGFNGAGVEGKKMKHAVEQCWLFIQLCAHKCSYLMKFVRLGSEVSASVSYDFENVSFDKKCALGHADY